MKLGELEFKAEDFDCHFDCTEKQHNVDCYARDNAERANKLLAERLEKAPKVFSKSSNSRFWRIPDNTGQVNPEECDLSARLVDICPIKE